MIQGYQKLQDIVQRRLTEAGSNSERAFDRPSSLNQLCHASGGYLRQLMTLIQSTCAEALAAHGTLPLRESDVNAAISNIRAELHLIAADYAEPLRRIASSHELTGIPPATRSDLLRLSLVYEYFSDGAYWYDVSPLLDE